MREELKRRKQALHGYRRKITREEEEKER